MPDAELVRRVLGGDDDAFRQIVTTHQTAAYRTAWLITRSEEDARDATQDAFLKAYRALARFDRHRPLRPWLMQIVANEARNRVRANRRHADLELRIVARDVHEPEPSPLDVAAGRETHDELLAAVNTLPEDQRAVIGLRYFAGLSEEETAAALGVPPGTAKSRHSRALAALRARLEAGDD